MSVGDIFHWATRAGTTYKIQGTSTAEKLSLCVLHTVLRTCVCMHIRILQVQSATDTAHIGAWKQRDIKTAAVLVYPVLS